MIDYLAQGSTEIPFELFGRVHMTALGIVGLFILSLFILRRSSSAKLKDGVRIGLASLLVINQFTRHLQLIYLDQ